MPRTQTTQAPKPNPAAELAERLRMAGERTNAARERRYQGERDLLVAVLSRIWPSHIMRADKPTLFWSEVVCIHSPVGQLAWGLPADRLHLFAHLAHDERCTWDRHGAAQRDARLRQLLKLETLTASPTATPKRRTPRRKKEGTK